MASDASRNLGEQFNPFCWIVGKPIIGLNCWIGPFTLIDASGGLSIGPNCDISAGVQLYTHSTIRQTISDNELPIERAETTIEENVYIGAGAIVLMGVHIGHHSVIAAGTVVPQYVTVPPWSLVIGIPGRIQHDAAHQFGLPDPRLPRNQ